MVGASLQRLEDLLQRHLWTNKQDNRLTLLSAQRPDQSGRRQLTRVAQVRAEQKDKFQLYHGGKHGPSKIKVLLYYKNVHQRDGKCDFFVLAVSPEDFLQNR